jgi:hypothetical protein
MSEQPPPATWARAPQGAEHPDSTRIRIEKEYIDTITALRRENIDAVYEYLTTLIEKAKEELGHARSSSNDLRRAALGQHIEEISAYLKTHGIATAPPNKYGEQYGAANRNFYVLEEIPGYIGEIKCIIDQWRAKQLDTLYDELLKLINIKA